MGDDTRKGSLSQPLKGDGAPAHRVLAASLLLTAAVVHPAIGPIAAAAHNLHTMMPKPEPAAAPAERFADIDAMMKAANNDPKLMRQLASFATPVYENGNPNPTGYVLLNIPVIRPVLKDNAVFADGHEVGLDTTNLEIDIKNRVMHHRGKYAQGHGVHILNPDQPGNTERFIVGLNKMYQDNKQEFQKNNRYDAVASTPAAFSIPVSLAEGVKNHFDYLNTTIDLNSADRLAGSPSIAERNTALGRNLETMVNYAVIHFDPNKGGVATGLTTQFAYEVPAIVGSDIDDMGKVTSKGPPQQATINFDFESGRATIFSASGQKIAVFNNEIINFTDGNGQDKFRLNNQPLLSAVCRELVEAGKTRDPVIYHMAYGDVALQAKVMGLDGKVETKDISVTNGRPKLELPSLADGGVKGIQYSVIAREENLRCTYGAPEKPEMGGRPSLGQKLGYIQSPMAMGEGKLECDNAAEPAKAAPRKPMMVASAH